VSITPSNTPVHAKRNAFGMAIIGRTLHDLRGIRYEEGEGGAGGDAAAQAAAAATKAAADKAAADAAAKPPWGDDPTKFDPDKAWNLITNLRNDVEGEKTKRDAAIATAVAAATEKAAKDAVAGIAKLLSGEKEPETDPVKLAAQVTDLSTQVSEKDTTLTKAQADLKASAIYLAAATIGAGQANLKLLLANEEFKTSIASVEPTDEAAIQAKITAALQANPALKATPGRSGSDGHQGGQVADLRAQLAAAEKANDRSTVISLKRRIAALAT
jgi:hypothetical protein